MNGFDGSWETLPFQFCEGTRGNTARTYSRVPDLMEDVFHLRTDWICLSIPSSLSVRNSYAEDSVCRPRAPLFDIRAAAHLPPSPDPAGECAGANHKVLDGVEAEGETLERSHLNPNQIEVLLLRLSSSCLFTFASTFSFSKYIFSWRNPITRMLWSISIWTGGWRVKGFLLLWKYNYS